jgi:hypothetical protein
MAQEGLKLPGTMARPKRHNSRSACRAVSLRLPIFLSNEPALSFRRRRVLTLILLMRGR